MKTPRRLAVTAVLALLVAGCSGPSQQAGQETPGASPTVSASASPSASPSDSPKPSRTPPATVAPTPELTTEAPAAAPTPAEQVPAALKSVREMTDQEAYDAYASGQVTDAEYCSRDTWLTSGATQHCYLLNYPEDLSLENDVLPPQDFTYDQAFAAWQGGMAYYDAFCANYTPVTPGGVSQCDGIMNGTVDYQTGEYIGDQFPSIPEGQGFGCFKDENGSDYCVDPGPEFIP